MAKNKKSVETVSIYNKGKRTWPLNKFIGMKKETKTIEGAKVETDVPQYEKVVSNPGKSLSLDVDSAAKMVDGYPRDFMYAKDLVSDSEKVDTGVLTKKVAELEKANGDLVEENKMLTEDLETSTKKVAELEKEISELKADKGGK